MAASLVRGAVVFQDLRGDLRRELDRSGGNMLNRGTLVGLVALAAALVVAIPANADHASVNAFLTIKNGEKEVVFSMGDAGCSGTDCVVPVPVAKRDVGRVSRWCGATSIPITLESSLPAGARVGPGACSGGGSWTATVEASRDNTHAEAVTVLVMVVEQ
jgi:hypothetical protein